MKKIRPNQETNFRFVESDQDKEDISEISAECLTTCLQSIGIAYDIICDSRISILSHTLLHAPPPPEHYDSSTHKGLNFHESQPMSQGLWHIIVDSKTSKKLTTLTESGREWFDNLTSLSPESLNATSALPPDFFSKQYFELIMDSNHTLCDNALTILRRCYGTQHS